MNGVIKDGERRNWLNEDNDSLINHILVRYHQNHRKQLRKLVVLSEQVDKLYQLHPRRPKGLSTIIFNMSDVLFSHMEEEERLLFPLLRQGLYQVAAAPIAIMEQEHASHDKEIAHIYSLTDNLRLPDNVCQIWQELYRELGAFISDLKEHIRLENETLFRRFKLL